MVTCFPFVHDGEFNPVYCAIYNDNYSWRLGKIEYADPDNISIFVTADSIKRSEYDRVLCNLVTFTRRKKFCLEKVECVRTDI
jgi:hypothetical protein